MKIQTLNFGICEVGSTEYICIHGKNVVLKMSKKQQARPDGLMYSTNKDFFNNYENIDNEQETLAAESQKLKISLDTKQRAGKVVTIVSGFVGYESDLMELAKRLKTKCGAGGSTKEGMILIQGDYKIKIITWLQEWGYKNTK